MLLLLSLLHPSVARADEAALSACCRAGGASVCPMKLQVRTERSGADTIGLGWEVTGAYELSCNGKGTYDPTRSFDTDHDPVSGEVLTEGVNPLSMHCFQQACAMPAGVCVATPTSSGVFGLVGCDDALPVDQKALSAAARPGPPKGARVVLIDGRPLVAVPTDVPGPPPPTPAWTASAWDASTGAATSSATPPPTSAFTSSPTSYATAAPTSNVAAPAPAAAPAKTATLSLPADPPNPCTPAPDAVRSESRKRVGTGDDFRVTGRVDDALRDYQAALTMDKCNGYAWLSIAQLAADAQRPDLAIRALRNTTLLLPAHPGAFLMLGRAYESFGQRQMAADAYKRATELSPGNAEAVEGYMRTRG